MRIPMADDLGNRVADNPIGGLRPSSRSVVGEALGQFSEQLQGAVRDERHEQKRIDEENQRVAATNALLNVRVDSHEIAQQVTDRLQTGELAPDDAEKEYTDLTQKASTLRLQPLTGNRHAVAAGDTAKAEVRQAGFAVTGAVIHAKRQVAAAEAFDALDKAGKMSALPNVPLDDALTTAAATFPTLAKRAGLGEAEISKRLQDWTDSTRFDRAALELTSAKRDAASLDAFDKRLAPGGDLFGTLDSKKVLALTRESESHRYQLQQRAQRDADKREVLAGRWLGGADKQIESGVPLTAAAWDEGRKLTAGTEHAERFDGLMRSEQEVQQVLRLPLDQQQAYVQQREERLMQSGGTLADKANLTRLRSTVESNQKQLETAPLVAAQRLYGQPPRAFTAEDLTRPDAVPALTALFSDRVTTLQTMRQQFGERVPVKPLLPQEAQLITKVLDTVGPSQAAQVFAGLRTALLDDETYRAAMNQIAPDSPVKARAGELAAMREGVITEKNVLTANVVTSTAKIARTMLAGEAIINRTKGAKTEDGKGYSLFVPDRKQFDTAFVEATGDLYRGRPGAQEVDRQAAFAYLVGRSAETGHQYGKGEIDAGLMKESLAAAVGAVVDVNGNGRVKAPIGMDEATFRTKVQTAFSELAKTHDAPDALPHWASFGLTNYRADGTYLVTLGGAPVTNPKTGAPVVLDVLPRTFSRYGPRGVDLIPKGPR